MFFSATRLCQHTAPNRRAKLQWCSFLFCSLKEHLYRSSKKDRNSNKEKITKKKKSITKTKDPKRSLIGPFKVARTDRKVLISPCIVFEVNTCTSDWLKYIELYFFYQKDSI